MYFILILITLIFAHYYPNLNMKGPNSIPFSISIWIQVAAYNTGCLIKLEFYINNDKFLE